MGRGPFPHVGVASRISPAVPVNRLRTPGAGWTCVNVFYKLKNQANTERLTGASVHIDPSVSGLIRAAGVWHGY
jgi:hypothetical protein